jgi:hypothetical protein
MTSAIAFLEETAEDIVEAGGLLWKVERVTNDLPAERRGTLTLMAFPRTLAERAQEEDIRARHTDRDGRLDEAACARDLGVVRAARQMEALQDPAYQMRLRANRAALVRVGAVATQIPGSDVWEPIRLVATREEADAHASPPRVWEGRLNDTTKEALFTAIWRLCTDGGAAIERLERFRSRGA